MNKNVFLLDGFEITGEIYCENGKPWVWFMTGNSTGIKFPITCIADVERALGKVLIEAVQQAEGE